MIATQQQAAVLAAACLIGVVIASLQYSAPNNASKAAADLSWRLPELPDTSATRKAYEQLGQYYRSNLPAGQSTTPGQAPTADATWTLQGLERQDQQAYALIASNNKITRFRVGQQLPDSAVLTGINKNGITIDRAGASVTVKLHGGQPK